jgi:dinuclear metal center YbgI/SA1388 family protein
MVRIAEVMATLEKIAPLSLAEEWDNVGLLVGDPEAEIDSALTCLSLTSDVAAEAIQSGAGLIISHHPILFRPVQQITSETWEGRMLLDLMRAGIAVYSAHTAYDSARDGINSQLAQQFGLTNVTPIRAKGVMSNDVAAATLPPLGSGRCGNLPSPMTLAELIAKVKETLGVDSTQFAGDENLPITRLGIACGSAAEFLSDAKRAGCQALLTGEGRFHSCIEAHETGIALILAGHYATERPAVERLAAAISKAHGNFPIKASTVDKDPVLSR